MFGPILASRQWEVEKELRLGTRYAETRTVTKTYPENSEEAKLVESLREQLVGKGIVVDKGLLWSGDDCQPNDDLTQIKSGPFENEAQA